MRSLSRIAALLALLTTLSCIREESGPESAYPCYPEGTPVMLNIGFGVPDQLDVTIGTKAESSRTDEARVRDLYVMLFDEDGVNFYRHYFTFEHLNNSLQNLDSNSNEGWYVENSNNSFGVVKIATLSKPNCTLVMLANVDNTITTLNHRDAVDVLSSIGSLSELQSVRVTLEQEIVDRADVFLMMDMLQNVNTGDLVWGHFDGNEASYNKNNGHFQLQLKPLDAKVKFWIKYNQDYIDPEKSEARKWQVFNVPSECYLLPSADAPSSVTYFDTQKAFFEGTDDTHTFQIFSFYMLENRQEPASDQKIANLESPSYYLREKESDPSSDDPTFIYAPQNSTYVKFDLLLGLKTQGIQDIVGPGAKHALTTDAMYTVHLGQFGNSNPNDTEYDWDNYDVERSTSYNYYVTVNNSKSIYIEVMGDPLNNNEIREDQPGQEGSLLLSTDAVVNCDAHYEYHSLTFNYTPALEGRKVSWYVKTPFDEGGAQWDPDANDGVGDWEFNCNDYLWVKFGLNATTGSTGTYSENRVKYPGDTYDKDWDYTKGLASNQLMDIHQLYNFILDQTKKRNDWLKAKASGPDPGEYTGAFLLDTSLATGENDDPATTWVDEAHHYVIRVTAFIDEYYYEKDPTLDPATAKADPELWRKFVNADPRELHILSEAVYSEDKQSDVITSSHSIIQRSIQTFYNTYSPDLRTLWGTEHQDEMEYRIRKQKDPNQTIWPWWKSGRSLPTSARPNNDDNGRYNSAAIWGVSTSTSPAWDTFLNYTVDNNTPELQDDYKYLAYSCLTRNRDNDGDGHISPKEVRWYMASVNQLVGMWVGNEALSPSARLYQPENRNSIGDGREWRSWVVSSTATDITNPRVIRAEEGATKSNYSSYNWAYTSYPSVQFTDTDRHQVSSVRCVRNIGTYDAGGEVKDINEADLSVIPDQYYESPQGFNASGKVNANGDGTYTLRFSRLDPRCIREFTTLDLPYADEYSMQNRVYMEMIMQDPSAEVTIPANKTQEELNDLITAAGHNSYCPAGYRLPNMTELLLMSALQSSGYWANKKYPSRTYYSRGFRGSKITPGENHKIGWGYDGGIVHMHNSREKEATIISDIRCVKDMNCTGEITGSISVPGGDKLHMGDDCQIKLNITSLGSAIRSLNLYLVYVGTSGNEETRSINLGGIKLSGVAIQDESVDWTVPTDLTLLGDMYIRAIVVNNAGIRKVLETPIRILSPVFASVRLLPCVYNAAQNPSYPVMITAHSPSSDIRRWTLIIKDPDNETTPVNINACSGARYWNTTWQFAYSLNSLATGTYSFQLDVLTADGKHTLSNIAEMDVLRINYVPNPGHTGDDGYKKASDITVSWEPDVVTGMNMASGDFIEANIDLSNCSYYIVYKTDPETGVELDERDNDQTLGKDNIISIGITDTDHGNKVTVPYVYHIYYPAHDDDESANPQKNWLRPNISKSTGSDKSNGTNYKLFKGGEGTGFMLQSGNYYMPDPAYPQLFRLEKAGAFWNGQWMDPANWNEGGQDGNPSNAAESLAQILSSDTFYIGSTQGTHRSRATYFYVRAVRNGTETNAAGGGVSINDPINGGNL
ncbi:MAG: DUF4906 domain-containing protein [Bacteroidales bacterium]|nr:DUF4906 domain-containing protein [Bacteroidales bacterium]